MKTIKSAILSLFSVLLLFSSCKKEFFDTSPSGSLTDDQVYSSTSNIDALVNGTIRYLMENATSQDNPGYGAILLSQEAMGNDAVLRDGVYGYYATYSFTDPFDNTTRRALFFWTLQYKVIDNCNNIIAKVDAAAGPDADKKYLKGQALALRGFVYLNLIRQYQFTYAKDKGAKGVPLYTEPTTSGSTPKARASVEQVYNQVLADLKQAETLLNGYKRPSKDRPDQSVVRGLLARTYLTMENWDQAAAYAALARTAYPIMTPTDYLAGFNDVSNVEWLWGHPQTSTQNLGGASFFAYIDVTPATGYRSVMADPNFRKLFEDKDVRKSLFSPVTDTTNALVGWLKYTKFVNKADQSGHIPLMRSSELALIQAESNARQGKLPDAINALNEVRLKRGLVGLTPDAYTPASLTEEVLLERRRELWGEGFQLPDLLRLQRSVVRKASTEVLEIRRSNGTIKTIPLKGHLQLNFPDKSNFVANSPYYLFSIPINELNNNPQL
ncbi:RagB/SusD family nutrient uptake outer membrane protein [Pedobacter nutrimenti]|uniref:SusD-like starch-binding protein associating with outer membrane n=1 Tax=Pedobacter nutrimenti TaxID=1241337 RepID=A0A318UF29_9SPHI|nr:RagB/SusD family nutrient uptake outer membrane protein [Pedobacter nutrimenti]PYF75034.1 SusD-like starch-binding protein associating with outer membrane [Pedobacter nutrimenti]